MYLILFLQAYKSISFQLIESVIRDLERLPEFSKNGVVVRLHGFFQTDDRLAIQEITRQLFLEEEAAKRTFGSFSGVKPTSSLVCLNYF